MCRPGFQTNGLSNWHFLGALHTGVLGTGGRTCFGDIWIFAKFLIGLHRVLPIPLFKIWTAHILCIEILQFLNPTRFKVEPHSKYWYFCFERRDLLSLRFSENAVLFHTEWLCRKPAGNVNRPPYRYTAVTHWACPASSVGNKFLPTLVLHEI